jgi:alanine dehydrogenase
VFDRDVGRLRALEVALGGRVDTVYASKLSVEQHLAMADLVIGAVLEHGARTPRIVRREQLTLMKQHAVLIDVSIDQGGCFETSRPTTHSDPTFVVDGITHYCVANMPGAVPLTSTRALTNATIPYIIKLAGAGVETALESDPGFRSGLNIASGSTTYRPLSQAQGRTYVPPEEILGRLSKLV